MITITSFMTPFQGHANAYSTYRLIGKKLSIKNVVNRLNIFHIHDKAVGNGKIENLDNDWNCVTFEICKESPSLIYDMTSAAGCIGYADDWDGHYILATKNGKDFSNFTTRWDGPDMPYERDDGTKDCPLFDAFVKITDNESGYTFEAGTGACEKFTVDYYQALVDKSIERFYNNPAKSQEEKSPNKSEKLANAMKLLKKHIKYVKIPQESQERELNNAIGILLEELENHKPVKVVFVTYMTIHAKQRQEAFICDIDDNSRVEIKYHEDDILVMPLIRVEFFKSTQEAINNANKYCMAEDIHVLTDGKWHKKSSDR